MRLSSKSIIKNKRLSDGEVLNLDLFNEVAVTKEILDPYLDGSSEVDRHIIVETEDVTESEADVDPESLYQEAQKKAALLIKAAQEDALKIEREAFEKGYAEGLKKAQSEYEDKLQKDVSVFASGLVEVVEAREKTVLAAKSDLESFLLLAVEKICRKKVSEDKHLINRVLEEILPLLAGSEEIIIEVNPKDLEVVESQKATIMASALIVKEIRIVADEKVERGGCMIHSNLGSVDARVSTQLDAILNLMQEPEQGVKDE